jgi:uncharacterized protein YbjT (DUF2867 family)
MILVTGATGNIGRDLVAMLAAGDTPIRAFSLEPGTAPFPAGVDAVYGDLDSDAFVRALEGVRSVFLHHGAVTADGTLNLESRLARARDAGVEHVVLLSGGPGGGSDLDNAVERDQILSERAVRASGLRWTILRASGFASNVFRWLPQLRAGDALSVPFAGVPVAAIDPYDIAAVAALALTTGDHDGATYRLTGPEPILPAEQAAQIAEALGRDLTLRGQPDDEARAELLAFLPSQYVDALFTFFVDGTYNDARVLPTVEDLTGRPPRAFADWLAAHAEELR